MSSTPPPPKPFVHTVTSLSRSFDVVGDGMSGSGSLLGRNLIPWRMNSVIDFLSQTSPKKFKKAPAVVEKE